MRTYRSFALILSIGVLVLSACGTSSQTGQATATPTKTGTATTGVTPSPTTSTAVPRLEAATCPFKVGRGIQEGQNLNCYNLVVHEDRANPNSTLLKLPVAIFKAPVHPAAADPVIYLDGGPGGGGVYDFAPVITSTDRSFFLSDRDLILIDQRGTGYSQPSQRCTETDALIYQTDVNLTPDQGNKVYNDAVTACHTRLLSQHIDLSKYTTYTAAADVHDLIQLLNLQQVNLWGISYGTRLAEEMMRSFPQGVRSVILDSSVPPSVSHLDDPKNQARVFSTLWSGCKASATCNSKYPNLEQTFYTLYAKLNATPITFQATDVNGTGKTYTVLFNGDSLVSTLFTTFYVTSSIADDPKMITQIMNGDTTLLASFYGNYQFDTSISTGLYYSVECAEDLDFASHQDYLNAGQNYPAPIRPNQTIGFIGAYEQPCATWNVPKVDASQRQNITSTIPTVIFADEYDPVTPPSNGATNLQGLKNGYLFSMPGLGHGAFTNGCADSIRFALWANPGQKPDGACVTQQPEPLFT